jgi:serpin B
MFRPSLFAAYLLIGASTLCAQSPAITAPQTLINDTAWSGSATALDLSRARSRPASARLINVSIRARAGTGANTLIAGAAVQGAGSLPVIVRAIGPGLAQFGVADALREPQLEVFRGATLAARTNTTGPGVAAASAYVGAFPPLERATASTPGDAMLVGQVAAGTLTAHCSALTGGSGLALLEFYAADASPGETAPRFLNLSSRARVEPNDGIIVAGFVVAGEGTVTLLLRGVGPTLQSFGVPDYLRDPAIELYAGGVRIATNDDWRSQSPNLIDQLEQARLAVGAFALGSANDAAMLVTLPAGAYTLQVRGVGSLTGVALAEIHEVSYVAYDAALATNAVGLDVFRELARPRPSTNLIVSPYSIESALALAYAGADGTTREEMARVLRLPDDNASLQSAFAALRRALEQVAENSRGIADARTRAGAPTDPIQWSAANQLFGQTDYPFRESFLSLMRDGFSAPLTTLEFRRSPEVSRLFINRWVEGQTREKIVDLIPAGGVNEDTRLVLVNALYLKAPWQTPFEKVATLPRPFFPAAGPSRAVPTMQQTTSLGYTREENCTVVAVPYLGSELQFLVILPDESQGIDAVAARLAPAHFARWAKLPETSRREISLYLPKFRVKGASLPLGQTLRSLGVRLAFDEPRGSANFDRIAPRRPDDYLAISDVFHQTYVALDEEGTEAAAATAVVLIGVTSAPPPPLEVRVDRPFLFAIQHRASGACLFFGRISDPEGSL